MDKTVFRVPITRLDSEKHMVYGYASTGSVDSYDTVFDPEWWPYAIAGYLKDRSLSAMHEKPDVGTVPILEDDERGLWIGAEVTDPEEWERVVSGEYNGFSISAVVSRSRVDYRDGREIWIFERFYLDDITIGYPAANLDARFQLVERLEYDKDSPWDWDWSKDADAIVDQLGWKGLKDATLYQDPDADPETKKAYKLPVAKLKSGKLTVFWNGVRAAMAALNGARGDLEIPDETRKSLYNKIKKLYSKFGEEIPELRLETEGGFTMSKFTEKVLEIVQRLTGKAPDDAVKKEITDLETSMADERTKQIETLTAAVTGLTERLEKIEKVDDKTGDPDAGNKDLEDLTGTVKKIEERLAGVEKGIAKSQQPGEENDPEERTEKTDVFEGLFV